MKDGKFETQAEIYQHLLSGGKVRKDGFRKDAFIFLKDGIQVGLGEKASDWSFYIPSDWEIHQEPKQKVKIVAHMHEDGNIYYSEENSRVCEFRSCSDIFKRLSLSFDAEVLS